MNFKEQLKAYQKYVDQYLETIFVERDNPHMKYMTEVMNYSLLSKGKRIRPILNILFFEAFGGEREAVIEFASALEVIHTYSLVHDDLPSMDDDILRRRQATAHVKYDVATAILSGDALLNAAYEILFKYLNNNFSRNVLKGCQLVANASGRKGMVLGQIADMELANPNETIVNLEFINQNKTGKLLEASIVSAGYLRNQPAEVIKKLEALSIVLGHAFQLTDDLLEYTGTTSSIGKSSDSDSKNKKNTYIKFKGVEATRSKIEDLQVNANKILKELNIEHELIYGLVNYIFERRY